MLVLSRKVGETIVIDKNIEVTVADIKGNKVRLGINAPPEVRVLREELTDKRAAGRDEFHEKVYRILIVDDDQVDRTMIRRCLPSSQDRHFTFIESALGQEGLDRCRKERPDCVILDFRLPDIDGLKFLGELSNSNLATTIPVIVVTGQANDQIGPQVLRQGAQGFFAKRDISSDNLWQAITGALHACPN
jgi:carbon storage regulator CsrA